MMWDGTGGWGMGFGVVWMIVFWGLVIAAIVLAVRWLTTGSGERPTSKPGDTARDLLDRRYARGEIGHDEFEQRKRDLER